jgi:hypothetical protein
MIATLFISLKIRFQIIGKEKQLQHQEKNNQLDDNDRP